MKVSVIIPCYNGEEFIGQTLGSLLDQTRPADEIVVVDDGSTDRSAEIALRFGEAVTVLSKEGGGAANARNCGADHATGDAFMFLDADDVLGPEVLEHLLDQLKKNPGGVVACPWYRLEKIDGKWVKRPPSCKPLGKNQDYLSGWLTGWYHLPCSILWSRTAYENRGGWDPRAYVNDDGDLMMRALTDGVNLQITEKGASFYRRMPEQQLEESLSGARFTRKGREAQIYVVHKIAQMLEDRGKLNLYRKPVTQAFLQYRQLCMNTYPELSERCSELISQYGESHSMQIVRNVSKSTQKAVHSARGLLGILKKRVLTKGHGSNKRSAKKEDYEEIRFGLDTYQKVKSSGKKGKIRKPTNPVVSVILPVYDNVHAFEMSLKSVLNQTFGEFEVVASGNKDSGNLKSVIENVDDSRVRMICSGKTTEVNALRNRALKETRGHFTAFLTPGDEWHPAKLARQTECFQKASASVGLVYTGSEIIDHQGKKTQFLPVEKGDVFKKLLNQNVIDCSSSVMIRRTVIASIGFFDTNMPAFGYHDYWLRIARFFEFDFVEEPLVQRHKESDNRQSDSTENMDCGIEY